jgi:hypothetical protein
LRQSVKCGVHRKPSIFFSVKAILADKLVARKRWSTGDVCATYCDVMYQHDSTVRLSSIVLGLGKRYLSKVVPCLKHEKAEGPS